MQSRISLAQNILIHSSTIFCQVRRGPEVHLLASGQPLLDFVGAPPRLRLDRPDRQHDRQRLHARPLPEHAYSGGSIKVEQPREDNILGRGLTVSGNPWTLGGAVDIVLRAGQMSFHHADIVHGSNPNTSTSARIGFAVRYVAADVEQSSPHYPGDYSRGDVMSITTTQLQERPTADIDEGLRLSARSSSSGDLRIRM